MLSVSVVALGFRGAQKNRQMVSMYLFVLIVPASVGTNRRKTVERITEQTGLFAGFSEHSTAHPDMAFESLSLLPNISDPSVSNVTQVARHTLGGTFHLPRVEAIGMLNTITHISQQREDVGFGDCAFWVCLSPLWLSLLREARHQNSQAATMS